MFVAAVFFGFLMSQQSVVSFAPQTVSLDGIWQVTRLPLTAEGESGFKQLVSKGGKTIDAQVPGEIHLDLMRAGEMEDPSVSSNSRKDRWPERFSWWYRTSFEAPAGYVNQERQTLVFDGLDYCAQIFVNGKLAGTCANALVPFKLDVTGSIIEGQNDLVVRLTSGYELVNEVDPDQSKMKLYQSRENFPARENLRKAPYTSGWDWCDTLPNIGIWRGVHLEGRSKASLANVRLDTELSGKKVELAGEVAIENLNAWRRTPCTLRLNLKPPVGPSITFKKELALEMGINHVSCRLAVPDPQMWWPNGYGAQPFYLLSATISCDGQTTDSLTQSIGLRTVSLDQSPCKGGTLFRFIVNGKPVFGKGGNWAPADQIAARNTKANYEHFIQAAKEAHFTMLRVNGVGIYEDDSFYDACDRAGILVWQEFSYSCAKYDDITPSVMTDRRREAEEFVKRIAHHPCVALWCGCNECLWMYGGDKNPSPSEVIGTKIYYDLLPSVCHQFDPHCPYIPGSPCGGTDEINSETGGDVHWWYQVFMSGDRSRKMDPTLIDTSHGRFVSEYGIIGPPPLATMKQYLKPEELNPDSLAWQIHTNSYEGDNKGFTEAAARHHFFGDGPMTVVDFVLYGGLYQAMMQEDMMEAGRFRKNDPDYPCDGTLMWSYNDCWGEIGWSIIDHYGRKKPSYYAVKRACAPLKVIVRSVGTELATRVVNDRLTAQSVDVQFGWFKLDGSSKDVKTRHVRVPANSVVEFGRAPMHDVAHDPHDWVYAAAMTGPDGDDCSIWNGIPCRELHLPKPKLIVKIEGDRITVTSPGFAKGVHSPVGVDAELSDDFFDLLPGVPHTIRIARTSSDGAYTLVASMPIER